MATAVLAQLKWAASETTEFAIPEPGMFIRVVCPAGIGLG